jgi:hypothetical protein
MWVTCNRKCWQEQSTRSRFSGIPRVLCYAAVTGTAAAAAAAAHCVLRLQHHGFYGSKLEADRVVKTLIPVFKTGQNNSGV